MAYGLLWAGTSKLYLTVQPFEDWLVQSHGKFQPHFQIICFPEKFLHRVEKLVMSQHTRSPHLTTLNGDDGTLDGVPQSQDISARDINPAKLTSFLRDKFGSGSYNVHRSSGLDDAQYVHDKGSETSVRHSETTTTQLSKNPNTISLLPRKGLFLLKTTVIAEKSQRGYMY
ncbi:hypothetical protein BDP55DRAFT_638636 [Colletotrichum godetiae]|uniref:Uncharacterized protein n=1 Tax=Colletotrichum godetiae TaxID=1209918 RepID=A0AAJ0A7M0_9PEZI|nr:uncharacterized protein BDP55DRAFT_638636 [Colletotrichum godetiae]KAK1657539.1 hypothetical protein BDP55DRAFT_638636 [Colletotrichum godetiae]